MRNFVTACLWNEASCRWVAPVETCLFGQYAVSLY